MSDAETIPLGSLLAASFSGGTPARTVPAYWNGNIPWASVKDFTDGSVEIAATKERISEAGLHASTAKMVNAGLPIVCMRMAVGRCAVSSIEVAINQDLKALIPAEEVDARFLVHGLKRLQPWLERRAIGSTVKGVSTKDLLNARLLRADLPEQRRIAEILDTIDEAIRKTEQVIAKLQEMKQGLLHDLLTRGIDENGELRDPERHPEQFKDSPLGRIPRGWQVLPLRALSVNGGAYGSGASAMPYDPDLPRYVRITDITDDGLLNPNTKASIGHSAAKPYVLHEGDLLFARSGATVGKTYLYRATDGYCAHAGYVIRFRIDEAHAVPGYVFYWTKGAFYASWVQRTLRQGAQPNINAAEYGRHLVALPPLVEQARSVAVLEHANVRASDERAALDKLHTLKQALMDDLLTGRVRVPLDEPPR